MDSLSSSPGASDPLLGPHPRFQPDEF